MILNRSAKNAILYCTEDVGFHTKKEHLRETLLFYFHLKNFAAESYCLLVEICGKHSLSETTYGDWFRLFKDNDFDVNERPDQSRKFEDGELEALEEDPCQTLKELSKTLNVDESTVSKRLKVMGMIQKLGNWVPHESRGRDIAKRFSMFVNCCCKDKNGNHFCIELSLAMKNGFVTTILSARNHGCVAANHNITIGYSWKEGYTAHLWWDQINPIGTLKKGLVGATR